MVLISTRGNRKKSSVQQSRKGVVSIRVAGEDSSEATRSAAEIPRAMPFLRPDGGANGAGIVPDETKGPTNALAIHRPTCASSMLPLAAFGAGLRTERRIKAKRRAAIS